MATMTTSPRSQDPLPVSTGVAGGRIHKDYATKASMILGSGRMLGGFLTLAMGIFIYTLDPNGQCYGDLKLTMIPVLRVLVVWSGTLASIHSLSILNQLLITLGGFFGKLSPQKGLIRSD